MKKGYRNILRRTSRMEEVPIIAALPLHEKNFEAAEATLSRCESLSDSSTFSRHPKFARAPWFELMSSDADFPVISEFLESGIELFESEIPRSSFWDDLEAKVIPPILEGAKITPSKGAKIHHWKTIYDRTLMQEEAGLLLGPLDEDYVSSLFSLFRDDFALARHLLSPPIRFPVCQTSKIRECDDFRLLSSIHPISQQLPLPDYRTIQSQLIQAQFGVPTSVNCLSSAEYSSRRFRNRRLKDSFRSHPRVIGRPVNRKVSFIQVDIKNAYKQLNLSKFSSLLNIIKCYDVNVSDGSFVPRLFRGSTLAFGMVNSVYSFNMFSSMLCRALNRLLGLSPDTPDSEIVVYFDDFWTFVQDSHAQRIFDIMVRFFRVLGVDIHPDKSGVRKRGSLLGLDVDTSHSGEVGGVTTFRIPDLKLQKLHSDIDLALSNPSRARLLKLSGKVNFYRIALGRSTRLGFAKLLHPVFQAIYQTSYDVSELNQCLREIREVFSGDLFSSISLPGHYFEKPIIIFSDAALSTRNLSLGGFQLDPLNNYDVSKAWLRIDPDSCEDISGEALSTQSLGIAELEALALVETVRRSAVPGRRIVAFNDNLSVCYALINGKHNNRIVEDTMLSLRRYLDSLDSDLEIRWIKSQQNPADLFTRLNTQGVLDVQKIIDISTLSHYNQ